MRERIFLIGFVFLKSGWLYLESAFPASHRWLHRCANDLED